MVFSSSISSLGAGKVQNLCKPEAFNNSTEEPKMMSPEHDYYTKLGIECVKNRVTVDLFFAFSQN